MKQGNRSLWGIGAFLCISLVTVYAEAPVGRGTMCTKGLNYTLPMVRRCKNGTIPKLEPFPSTAAKRCHMRTSRLGIPPGARVCREPDCSKKACGKGWCEETMMSYVCHCPRRRKGRNCEMIADQMFVTDARNLRILVADLDSLEFTEFLHSLPGKPKDVSFDRTGRKLYWCYQEGSPYVWRSGLLNKSMEQVTNSNLEGIRAITVTQSPRMLYVLYNKKITRMSIDPDGGEADVATLDKDEYLAFTLNEGILYWTLRGSVDIICTTLENGSSCDYIHTNDNISITGLSIDTNSGRLLFCTKTSNGAYYTSLTATHNEQTQVQGVDTDGAAEDKPLLDVTIFDSIVYWLRRDGVVVTRGYASDSPKSVLYPITLDSDKSRQLELKRMVIAYDDTV